MLDRKVKETPVSIRQYRTIFVRYCPKENKTLNDLVHKTVQRFLIDYVRVKMNTCKATLLVFFSILAEAIPHKERLATLHAICLQISRHISQKCS
ncbi:hypothetical protein [Ruminococcus callidus]|uniref:hypothetical protein n=1 Tax=Ruminococcus callidus TaxID=40519 RepID=UPI002676261A|nr:hypothetical protein [uncultured Ruminococcus sp.]